MRTNIYDYSYFLTSSQMGKGDTNAGIDLKGKERRFLRKLMGLGERYSSIIEIQKDFGDLAERK
jgi:hypothetical protein